MVLVQPDQGVAGLEPQGLADQPEGHRVQALGELDVGVPMDLDLGPHRQHRRGGRQGLQQGAFGRQKLGQRLFARGAMATLTGLGVDPLHELLVGIGQAAELPQRQEGALDVFDPRLDDAFFLGIPRRTGFAPKPIPLRAIGIGPLDFGIVQTGFGDGALGVVDDQPPDHPAERLEGVAMTGQPRGDVLVAHHFRVLMARPAQGHHKHPGLEDLAGAGIGDRRPRAEIDLGGLAGLELSRSGTSGAAPDGNCLRKRWTAE